MKLEPNTQGVAKDFITTELSLELLSKRFSYILKFTSHIWYIMFKFSICPK